MTVRFIDGFFSLCHRESTVSTCSAQGLYREPRASLELVTIILNIIAQFSYIASTRGIHTCRCSLLLIYARSAASMFSRLRVPLRLGAVLQLGGVPRLQGRFGSAREVLNNVVP